MFCVYFHKKPNGEIFYVGIGDSKRPYSKFQRNQFWHNIVKKYGYEINVVHENVSWEEACYFERDYIRKLGRRDLKTGTLVNMTDGGDGTPGVIVSKENRIKMSLFQTGRIRSEETKRKISISKKGIKFSNDHKEKLAKSNKATKSVIQYSMDGKEINKFESIDEASKQFKNPKVARIGITQCVNSYPNRKSSNGFIWKFNNI